MILVVRNDDGTFTEDNPERAVLWVRDQYTKLGGYYLDSLECANCTAGIRDTDFMICVDLGEFAHVWCVKTDGGGVPSGRLWWEAEGWP